MKYFLFACISLCCFFAQSSEVVIRGKTAGFSDSHINAYLTKDYITSSLEKVSSASIEDGQFFLSVPLEKTQKLTLTIEDKSTSLFVEPGQVYNINLSYSEELNEGKIYDKFLSIKFPYPTPTGLNELIASFNKEYDQFFQQNYKKVFLGLAANDVEAFVKKMQNAEKYQTIRFLQEYVQYATANLLDISGVPDKQLKNDFLNNKPILYHNPEFMNFFKQLFDERFRQFAITSSGAEMRKAIMLEKDLPKALKVIQTGESISSAELAELYLLNGLFEDYFVKTIDQKSNKQMLELIAQKGKTPENKAIAINILSKLRLTQKDSKAPAFTLKNSSGKKVSLSDFKGKYVYLNFWSSWSVPSLKELNVMKILYQKYKDKVEFISINLDDNPEKMKKILQENKYPWPFLHYAEDIEVKEKYQVRTVPSYYFIDKNGYFVSPIAPSPLNIEETFWNLK